MGVWKEGLGDWKALFSGKYLLSGIAIGMYLGLTKLLVPFLVSADFGFQRDEFLYMAMGAHPAWGYLEVPPAISVVARMSAWLFGNGLPGIRIFPALTGVLTLILTGLIAREFGGGRFAQSLSAITYLFSLLFLRINLLFQPVTFNLFYFVAGVYLLIRILKTNQPKYWILIGAVTGLGLLNKYSMLLFAFGAAAGLLLTPYRRYFRGRWVWISAFIALGIWAPNLLWQQQHGWPFFQHMQVLSQQQLSNVQPGIFLLVQVLMNLYATPIWLAGLYFCLVSDAGKTFRPIGWMYFSILAVLLALSGKAYYLAPAYPMLIAAGAVAIERMVKRSGRNWLKPTIIGLVIAGSATTIPIGLPVLSVENMIRYFDFGSKYMGMEEALRWETGELHELPQDYADMLGWEELVAEVAKTYHSLSETERQQCAIFASNYGEAGALDYYAAGYGLPKSVSHSGSYWLWGYRSYDGHLMILVGLEKEVVSRFFHNVEEQGRFHYPHARENGAPIIVARHLRISVNELWANLKQFRY